jgi:hypothetical protein
MAKQKITTFEYLDKELGFFIEPSDTPTDCYSVYVNGKYSGYTTDKKLIDAYNLCAKLATKLLNKK